MAGETIMIVEDDIISAEALSEKLTGFGYTVPPPVDNGKDAILSALDISPDLVLMDIKLSGAMDGITAAANIQRHLDVPVIYMTAYTDQEILQRARNTAPYSYLVKPVRDRELQITIEMVLYRHRMEIRLKEREHWLDTVLRSIGDAVLTVDGSGLINFMNAVAENLTGWSFAEASGKPYNEILQLVNEKTGNLAENPLYRVMQEGKVVGLANHTILVAKDGTRRAIDDSAAPVLDENGRLTGVVMVFRDVTRRRAMEKDLERHRWHLEELVAERTTVLEAEISERQKAENLLRQEIDFRRTIIENIAEGLCVWETIPEWPHIRFSLWNDRMIEITGYTMEEINRNGWYECLYPDPDERARYRSRSDYSMDGQPLKSDEQEINCVDGKRRTILLSASTFIGKKSQPQVLWLIRDITQRKEAEQERDRLGSQLRHAQKMEAIGTLAGGIAHDFNNILGAIIGYSELMEMFDVPGNSDIQENIEQVLKSAYRARDLVSQILVFSRQSESEKQPIILAPLIKEAVKFLRASLPSTIDIKQRVEGLPGTIMADPTQMHQVIMNLCTNAAQAMGDKGGVLDVNLSAEHLDKDASLNFPDLEPGTYAKLLISDTADGIAEDIRERIFDPYFTTKETGEGTGLGLAVTHGIVQQHGGAITFESEQGQGTIFQVMLPLDSTGRTIDSDSVEAEIIPGKGRILLVDDEVSLLRSGERALGLLGYDVDAEADSLAALNRFAQSPDSFDLIISDQTMPSMTGLQLAEKIKAIRPNIPIILCTGFSAIVTKERIVEIRIDQVIRKPVGIRELSDAVHRLIGS